MPPATAVIEVAIIEDEREVREGLAFLISQTEGFRCRHRYSSMEEAFAGFAGDVPQVALVDIGLPGMSGIEGVRILRQRHPAMQLLMLTVYRDDDRIFAALCAGACGYLLKITPPARLLESLREALAGGAPMSPEIAHRVVELFRRFQPAAVDYKLTTKEMELLQLLAGGHHYKTAATELGVSTHTVCFHLRHIYEKLQVHSKSEAVAKALRDGLIR